MPLSSKEQFDAYMKLADFRVARWNSRHELKWKTTLGVWGTLAAMIYTLKTRPSEAMFISILLGVIVLHFVYVVKSIYRTRHDMNAAFFYAELAERAVDEGAPAPRERPKFRVSFWGIASAVPHYFGPVYSPRPAVCSSSQSHQGAIGVRLTTGIY